MACTCGFSTEFPKCNGTHKIVNNVKGRILDEIDSITTLEQYKFIKANVIENTSSFSVKT